MRAKQESIYLFLFTTKITYHRGNLWCVTIFFYHDLLKEMRNNRNYNGNMFWHWVSLTGKKLSAIHNKKKTKTKLNRDICWKKINKILVIPSITILKSITILNHAINRAGLSAKQCLWVDILKGRHTNVKLHYIF